MSTVKKEKLGKKWSDTNDTTITIIYETGEWPKDFAEVAIIALRQEQGTTNCSDHNMHNQPHPTFTKGSSDNIGHKDYKKKLRTYLEKLILDFEEGKGARDAESSIIRKFGHRWRLLCFLHSLAEGIGPRKLDQIITDHDWKWYGLVWLNIDQKIVHGSVC